MEHQPLQFSRDQWRALQGKTKAVVYLDDIVVTRATRETHLKNLDKILEITGKLWFEVSN